MPIYLTTNEACEALGIHRNTLYKCIKAGAPVHRWALKGRQYRIIAAEFIAWMERHGEQHSEHAELLRGYMSRATAETMAAQRHEQMKNIFTA